MIRKANRIELRDEGVFQGYARSLDIVGPNVAGSLSGNAGIITWSGREVLTAARTYYVRTDGSDSNTGLANTAGGAFLTLAKAVAVVASLDLATFAVTIQIGLAGSYAGFTASGRFIGGPGSSVTVIGDPAAASSYVVTSTVRAEDGCILRLSGLDFTPAASDGLSLSGSAQVTLAGACTFGVTAAGARQILVGANCFLAFGGICTMDGSAGYWILANNNSVVSSNGMVHVFSGTPAYSVGTVVAQNGASMSIVNGTPTGAATGKRYDVTLNAVIYTNGGGANFFPGNVAGTATTGQYA